MIRFLAKSRTIVSLISIYTHLRAFETTFGHQPLDLIELIQPSWASRRFSR